MPKVSRRRLAAVAAQLLRERPQDRSHILRMLAAYLVERKQEKQADLVLLDIAHELAAVDGHLYADVSSAHALDDTARADLMRYLQAATGAQTIELYEHVEPELLAGAVIRTADHELDTSARTKLTRLRSLNLNSSRET